MANRGTTETLTIRAFTLAEVMVVIAVLGVIAALVAVNTSGLAAERQRRAEVDRLAKRLDYFRQVSIFQGKTVTVEIDPELHAYRAVIGPGKAAPRDQNAIANWEKFVGLELLAFDGVPRAELKGPCPIAFAPDGISDRHSVKLSFGSGEFLVTVGAMKTTWTFSQVEK
jgi:prepilin-type N-terminal cleavage/methylation domain-containing protein